MAKIQLSTKSMLAFLVVLPYVVSPVLAQEPGIDAVEPVFSVDMPLLELLKNPDSKAIVSKYLPNLVTAFEEDLSIIGFFGDATLKELSIDDDHVLGFDEELLQTISEELKQG